MEFSSPGGGTFRYIVTRYSAIRSIVTQLGGRAQSVEYLYHPFIRFNASLTRGWSEARRDSMDVTEMF